jgi:hypothetical protein
LELSNNLLTSILSETFIEWTGIMSLKLNNNNLTTLPESLTALTNIYVPVDNGD